MSAAFSRVPLLSFAFLFFQLFSDKILKKSALFSNFFLPSARPKSPPSARLALLSSASGPVDLFIENSSLSLQKLCLFIDSRPPYSISGGNE
ncbi:MAG: hypothetical protein ACI31N_04460 [Lacticaseibacillus absianus]